MTPVGKTICGSSEDGREQMKPAWVSPVLSFKACYTTPQAEAVGGDDAPSSGGRSGGSSRPSSPTSPLTRRAKDSSLRRLRSGTTLPGGDSRVAFESGACKEHSQEEVESLCDCWNMLCER